MQFLRCDKNAEEAMNFYVSVFRDSKVLIVTRYGKEEPGPEETVMNINSQLGLRQFVSDCDFQSRMPCSD